MRYVKNAALLLATLTALAIVPQLLSAGHANGEGGSGVHPVPGVRNANPTPDAPIEITVAMPGDGMLKIEGTVVISDAAWVCVDQPDGKTAWIPTSSIVFAQGTRTPVR